jgi:arginyl-tRNA synthetase
MIRYIQRKIEGVLAQTVKRLFDLEYAIPEGVYPDRGNGDLSYTFVFALAKSVRKNPKVIAQQIIDEFPYSIFPEVERVEIGGNGFVNFWLNRESIARELYNSPIVPEHVRTGKAIVEHTNINPNKAAHVGHLRNACLGDSLVRLLQFHGRRVEVQNYIDDTGVQLADVVLGFQRAGKTIDDLERIPRIDYYFWDVYAETHQWIEQSPENKKLREKTLKEMEERIEPTFSLSQAIADRIIGAHLRTMSRLGITYQLLPRESDIIGLHFWQRTFELLKEKGAITKVDEGKNKGCWIMSLSEQETFEEMQNPDKIIVRSNGTVTYVGKDIAYQLWKFGLLGLNFQYRVFGKNIDGSTLWCTSTDRGDGDAPKFGSADTVYNVIDQRQSYLQKVVAQGLHALGYHEQADHSIHFAYEMVTLSPKTALELGFQLKEEDAGKSFIEMSGRKGLGVKADDLMDRLQDKALDRVAPLYSDMEHSHRLALASDIATGALRYFMIRFTRNTIITFDMDEALNFEGETGPYLQYSLVRARSIFSKLKEAGFEHAAHDFFDALLLLGESKDQENDDSWRIILEIIKTRDVIARTLRSLEISNFAKFVFQQAQLFNYYYHKYPVLHEENERRKLLRIAIVKMFIQSMETNLQLLGIPVPSKM